MPCDMVTAVPKTTTRKKEAKSDLRTTTRGKQHLARLDINVGELGRKSQSKRDFGSSLGGKAFKGNGFKQIWFNGWSENNELIV